MTDLPRTLAACQFSPRSPSGVSCDVAARTQNGVSGLRCALAGRLGAMSSRLRFQVCPRRTVRTCRRLFARRALKYYA